MEGTHLSSGAAARRLGIDKKTLLRAMHRGAIRPAFHTPGGAYRFGAADVDAYARQLAAWAGRGAGDAPSGAEEAVRTREEHVRALSAHATDLVTVVDASGAISYASTSFHTILGYNPADLPDSSILGLLHPDDLPLAQQAFRGRVQDDRPPRTVELRVRHADGSWRIIGVIGNNRLADPAVNGIILTGHDMTERVRAEEALRTSEERYRTLIEHLPTVTYVAQPGAEGSSLYLSPQIERLLGFTVAEWTATPDFWITRLHPDDRARVLEAEERFQATGEPMQSECRYLAHDGRVVWVQEEAVLVHDATGHPLYTLGMMLDISARKQAEEALRQQLAVTTPIMHSLGEGVYALDTAGRVTFMNPAAEQLLGWRAEELQGKEIHEAIHFQRADGTPVPAADCVLLSVPRTGLPYRTDDDVFTRKDGTLLPVAYTCAPIKSADGVVGTVLAFRDMTQSKQAEAALRRSEETFRLLFRDSPEPMWVFDQETLLFLEVNDAAVARYGYTRAEFRSMRTTDLRPPEEVPPTEDPGVFTPAEWHHRVKDGRIIDVLISAHSLEFEGHAARLVVAHDMTARKQVEDALRHQTLHDALTGLPNRVLLQDRVQQALQVARREHVPLALLLLDLNGFKDVNDTFGHHVGDVLLQEVARRLQDVLRATDTVARLGGDEFAILLLDTDHPGAVAAAHKIRAALEAPVVVGEQELHVEGSLGIALGLEHGEETATLLQHADIAMYVAKEKGEHYALYAPDQDTYTPDRLALIGELRAAIADGDLHLHYQPKMDLATGQVVSVEALVRWQHPVRGLVRPDQFIPLAEHTGLIAPLTLWVLEEAVRQCQVWQQQGRALSTAVNLSTRNLQDLQLPAIVATLLERYAVPPARLTLEITESALMADPVRALLVLTRLRELGVRLSIDDFGTGYSSLAYLKQLPVDEVKIDQSFVHGMSTTSARDGAIVRSVIDLGHNLGLQVVAEGVEDQTTWDLLQGARCDVAQGYYLSRPVPAAELEGWLPTGPWRRGQQET